MREGRTEQAKDGGRDKQDVAADPDAANTFCVSSARFKEWRKEGRKRDQISLQMALLKSANPSKGLRVLANPSE